MKKIRLISVLLILIMMFAVVGCDNSKYSYWNIEEYTYSDGAKKEFFVQLSFDAEKNYEVWINIDSVEDDDAVISMAAGLSSTTMRYKIVDIVLTKEILEQANGWIKLNEGISSSYEMIDVATKNKMHINEIIVCEPDGKKYELTLSCAGGRIKRDDSNGNITTYEPSNSADSATNAYFSAKNNPNCVIDEQDKFDRATVAHLTVPTSSSSSSSK